MTRSALVDQADHMQNKLAKVGFNSYIEVRRDSTSEHDMHIKVDVYDEMKIRQALGSVRYKTAKVENPTPTGGASIFINLI